MVLREKAILRREKWIARESEKFIEEYVSTRNRKPELFEVAKFRKDLVLRVSLKAYLFVLLFLFIVWLLLKNGGAIS